MEDAPQQGLNLGRQHLQIKGLGDEVVPAHVHGHDNVHVVRRGREEDDRHPFVYRNMDDVVSIVYRRKNGGYGPSNSSGTTGARAS